MKYLGKYYLDYLPCDDEDVEGYENGFVPYFVNEYDETDVYETGLFMRLSNSRFDGSYTVSNNTAVLLKFIDSDYVRLWIV